MTKETIEQFVNQSWDNSVIPALSDFIRIPCKSPAFDSNWQKNGYLDRAAKLMAEWAKAQDIPDIKIDILHLENRVPLLFIDIPGDNDKTALLYGHLDKMPEAEGWDEGYGPWDPVLKKDKLFGRGSADDGYAFFAAMTAILALRHAGKKHPRCIIMVEAGEECGSVDLPYYLDHLKERIGNPELLLCLDSGCGNYEQLWCKTSLRGILAGTLEVKILTEGVHSGDAGGVIPGTFRILRQLLARIEDQETGAILLKAANVTIPEERISQAKIAADILGDTIYTAFPFVTNAKPITTKREELLLNYSWRPALCIIGAEGLPEISNAGNVLRAKTKVLLSMRLPPQCDAKKVKEELKKTLETNPPYGAHVTFTPTVSDVGWNAPKFSPWFNDALHDASTTYFGKDVLFMGEGGSIGLLPLLERRFPKTQFLVTGVLGPNSNAHGPNEFLHLPYVKKLTCCIAHIVAALYSN